MRSLVFGATIVRAAVLASFALTLAESSGAQLSDTSRLRAPNHMTYFELGGGGGYVSANYERKLNDSFTTRVGIGWWGVFRVLESTAPFRSEHARFIPLTLNCIPRIQRGSAHRLEFAAGMVFGERWTKEHSDAREVSRGFSAATTTVGYRWMSRPLVLRIGMTYNHRLSGDYPHAGLTPGGSVGFQLPFDARAFAGHSDDHDPGR
jgi:hypothetical protein